MVNVVSDMPVACRPVVLVGAGRWGKVHARQWSKICNRTPLVIVDRDLKRSKALADHHQAMSCETLNEAMDLLNDQPRPLMCIVTPTESLDAVAQDACQYSDLMLIEKPGLSTSTRIRGAVGYIERFNPARPKLAYLIRQAISAHTSIQLETYRLSSSAPSSTPLILRDLFCHDFDLLLDICEECGYQLKSLSNLSAEIDAGCLNLKLSATFIQTKLTTSQVGCEIHINSTLGQGERLRLWRINHEYLCHLAQHTHTSNPLYDQCKTIYEWSLNPQNSVPNRLCSIQKSVQRIRWIHHIANLLAE